MGQMSFRLETDSQPAAFFSIFGSNLGRATARVTSFPLLQLSNSKVLCPLAAQQSSISFDAK